MNDFFDSFEDGYLKTKGKDNDMLKAIVAIALGFALIFFAPIIGILAGAFTGWVVSILAPVWVPTGLGYFGIHVAATHLVELGAALGFIGGFLRVTKTQKAE